MKLPKAELDARWDIARKAVNAFVWTLTIRPAFASLP